MATVDNLDIIITAQATSANASLEKLVDTLYKAKSNLSGVSNSTNFTPMQKGFDNATKASGGLITGLTKMYATIRLLKLAFKGLFSAIEKSMNYIETLNYFDNAWQQVATNADLSAWEKLGYSSADAYVNSFGERAKELTAKMTGYIPMPDGTLKNSGQISLGINPDQVMQYQAMFGQMASSIGISSENALDLSSALTRIGADLASVRNMDFDKVWTDMASGLAGMSRTLDKYGVNIRNVNLQQKLNELGIAANISALNQNDKALLRTIILLDSTKYAWGDLAKTINQPANQLRMLKANFGTLAQTIGNLFMPVIAKVLPFINALVISLQRLFSWVGGLFGLDLSKFSTAVGTANSVDLSGISEDSGTTSNNLGNAAKNAKKLKDHLLGIDELNVIREDTETGSGSSGVGGGGVSGGLLDAAFADALAEYESAWNDAFSNIQNRAQELADKIAEIATYIADNVKKGFDVSFVSDKWDKFKENISGISDTLAGIANDPAVSSSMKQLQESMIQSLGSTVGAVASLSVSLGYGITGGINQALEESEGYIKDITTSIADNLTGVFDQIIDFNTALSEIGTAFESEGFQKIIEFFTKIQIFVSTQVLDTLTGLFSDLLAVLTQPFTENADKWKEFLENLFELTSNVITPLDEFLGILMDNSVTYEDSLLHKFLEDLAGDKTATVGAALDIINSGLEQLISITDGFSLSAISESFTNFGKTIETNVINPITEKFGACKDKITGFFTTLWENIKSIWNTVSTWFSENVIDPVVVFFTGLFERVSQIFEGLWILVQAIWKVVAEWFNKNVTDPLIDFFGDVKEKVSSFFSTLWENIKNVWNKVSSWFNTYVTTPVTSFFKDVWTKVKSFFSNLWSDVKGVWNSVATWFNNTVITPVKNAFETATNSIGTFFTNLWSGIKKGVVGAMNAVIGGIESGINFIVGGINRIIRGFNKIVSWAAKVAEVDWGGVDEVPTVSLSRISLYEDGGFPKRADLFWANENGVPELVGTMGGKTAVASGGEITGISDAVYATGEREASLLADAVMYLREIAAKEMSVLIGDKDIARSNNRGQRSMGMRLIKEI